MFAPETELSLDDVVVVLVASMRPGHVCPGNAVAGGPGRAGAPASMRPGHVCPGNAAGVASSMRLITQLQ